MKVTVVNCVLKPSCATPPDSISELLANNNVVSDGNRHVMGIRSSHQLTQTQTHTCTHTMQFDPRMFARRLKRRVFANVPVKLLERKSMLLRDLQLERLGSTSALVEDEPPFVAPTASDADMVSVCSEMVLSNALIGSEVNAF